MSRLLVVLPALVFILASCGDDDGVPAPSPGEWESRAPLPTPRAEVAFAELNDQIYVIGGMDANLIGMSTVEVYDPAKDKWSQAPDLPQPRHHAAAAAVNGRVYVIGGFVGAAFNDPQSAVYEYAPARKAWRQVASLPTPRAAMAIAVLDGKIYVAGGTTGAANNLTVAKVDVYDPLQDVWSEAAPLNNPRDHAAAVVLDGRLYVVGGRNGVNLGSIVPAVETYDLGDDSWETVAQASTITSGGGAAVIDDCIYVAGGSAANGDPLAIVNVLCLPDLVAQRYETMPTARHGEVVAAVNGVLYVIGGSVVPVVEATAVNEAFSPPLAETLADQAAQLRQRPRKMTCASATSASIPLASRQGFLPLAQGTSCTAPHFEQTKWWCQLSVAS